MTNHTYFKPLLLSHSVAQSGMQVAVACFQMRMEHDEADVKSLAKGPSSPQAYKIRQAFRRLLGRLGRMSAVLATAACRQHTSLAARAWMSAASPNWPARLMPDHCLREPAQAENQLRTDLLPASL